MTLWEILKANKTGIAPDMFTMLAASKMNGGRDRLHELSGIPPLSFTAKGNPLTAWSITGNTVQNGTPTPENPVEVLGCGDYDSETGLYKIPVATSADGTEPITTPIYLDSPSTICDLCNNNSDFVKLPLLNDICNALKCSISDIFTIK